MLQRAAIDFDLDLTDSVFFGDKVSDILAGKNAGVGRNIIVESGHRVNDTDRLEADLSAADLFDAVRKII